MTQPDRTLRWPAPTRRDFLAATGLTAAAAAAPRHAAAAQSAGFAFEITRTDDEWRAMLTQDEFRILRRGGTELPGSSELWTETRPGDYCCKGCDLLLYRGAWREPVDKGWVFFRHSEENAVLTGIDGPVAEYGMDPYTDLTMIEAHCRRCGSHLGHILLVDGIVLHCINGTSLAFTPL
ncbi:peptide-methionine (R)-S-oxide reductase [Meridianimarinicoccus sp. RP-17]|uniref:peptide-methionine (R)-S-oxide reductase n=1 Tax=Meridianimarinicoccus zhengii TaxID=2056810 RepID=UPI000DADA174|nr:peptide-methionine (R)-S-oxide reductase [Phycocomes zhengii]